MIENFLFQQANQLPSDPIAYFPEDFHDRLFRAHGPSGIRKPHMNLLGSACKDGATGLGIIAQGDDQVKGLTGEILQGLGSVGGNIHPHLLHHLDRSGVHRARICACRESLHPVPQKVTGPPLRHLATARITRTKEEDPQREVFRVHAIHRNPPSSRRAVVLAIEKTHNLAEAAGAAPIAAALKVKERISGQKVALIMSGGNLSLETLREILRQSTP